MQYFVLLFEVVHFKLKLGELSSFNIESYK